MHKKVLIGSLWCFLVFSSVNAGELLLRNGDSIAFLGDSITHGGVGSESGYVRMVVSGLKANGIEVKMIPAGVPGNKAQHMLDRMDKDVIAKHPVWMTLNCGVNDRWFYNENSTPEKFNSQVTKILDKAKKADIKVLLMTPTTIPHENYKILEPYCYVMKTLAVERNLPLADCHAAIRAEIDNRNVTLDGKHKVTSDGVHMAPPGNRAMARCVLEAFELNKEQLKKADAFWAKIPSACELKSVTTVRFETYRKAEKLADARSRHISEIYNDALHVGLKKMTPNSSVGLPKGQKQDNTPAKTFPNKIAGDAGNVGSILFVGDYFLSGVDRHSRSGYVRFVSEAMSRHNPNVQVVCEIRPMSMIDVMNKMDALVTKKPEHLVVSSVTYNILKVKLDQFKPAVHAIVDKAQKNNIKLIFITGRESRIPVDPYNAILHEVAKDNCRLVDAYAIMKSELQRRGLPSEKTSSLCIGYHLLPSVNALIADALLKSLAFNDKQISSAKEDREAFSDACEIPATIKMTFKRYDEIVAAAEQKGQSVRQLSEDAIKEGIAILCNQ